MYAACTRESINFCHPIETIFEGLSLISKQRRNWISRYIYQIMQRLVRAHEAHFFPNVNVIFCSFRPHCLYGRAIMYFYFAF